jgi:hypothetical protein
MVETGADDPQVCRSAELWVGLAQAAVGRGETDSAPSAAEPAVVARAIDEHQHLEGYDQVIVGYLQQIAEEVRTTHTPESLELRRRVSTLVSTLHPETLRRLLAMGGDPQRRREFVRTATAGVSAGAVVDLVKAAAEASNGTLSNGLVRLLTKLAAHAEAGVPEVQPLADSALRLQVERLTAGWDLRDPNPADYTDVLQRIARDAPAAVPDAPDAGRTFDDPLRVVYTCLEVDEAAPALWRAVGRLAEAGELAHAVRQLQPGRANRGLEGVIWDAITSADMLRTLVARVPPDFASVDVLLPHVRGDALAPLFDLLINSPDLHVRRATFDRLRQTGGDGSTIAQARLADEKRWYALRNLLALLAEIDALPGAFDPTPWLAHEDARVRREALRVALRLERLRDRALSAALADTDERVLRPALKAALDCPVRGAARRLFELTGREALPEDLSALAIQALVRVNRGPEVLARLLEIVTRNARWLRWPAREARSRATIAALSALAANWPQDSQVAAIVRRAATSPDAEIRNAVKAVRPW